MEALSRGATNPAARANIIFRARECSDADDLLLLFNDRTFIREASTRSAFASADELNVWLDHIVADQRFEGVASLESKVIGFGGLYALGDRLSHTGWVTLGVQTDFRRQGVGSTLLRLLLATANRLAKLMKVQLTVFVDNASAIRLYLKSGFEIEGVHRRFVRRDDGYVDAYSMAILFGNSSEGAVVRNQQR